MFLLTSSSDIQAKNIIIGYNDSSIFEEWAKAETETPSARKVTQGQTIYETRPFKRPKGSGQWGLPILSDFGEARIGRVHKGLIQPDLYRAPEVVLDMSWDEKVDIWSVGVMVAPPYLFPQPQKLLTRSDMGSVRRPPSF